MDELEWSEWKDWNGDYMEFPEGVKENDLIEIILNNGNVEIDTASYFDWSKGEEPYKISQYRTKDQKEIPENVELSTNLSKYQRQFFGVDKDGAPTTLFTDVYGVLDAFETEDAAIAHALKKLLAGGLRGTKGMIQDWKEAVQSIECAIKLEEIKQKVKED